MLMFLVLFCVCYRGMFTLSTYHPVPTETLQIPKLCLTGKVPSRFTNLLCSFWFICLLWSEMWTYCWSPTRHTTVCCCKFAHIILCLFSSRVRLKLHTVWKHFEHVRLQIDMKNWLILCQLKSFMCFTMCVLCFFYTFYCYANYSILIFVVI